MPTKRKPLRASASRRPRATSWGGGSAKKDSEIVPVLFRVWPKSEGGGVIALFPTIPFDLNGNSVESYEHVGQHSGADLHGVIHRTHPAKPAEYASLKRELESYPFNYKLDVKQRASSGMRATLMKEVRRMAALRK